MSEQRWLSAPSLVVLVSGLSFVLLAVAVGFVRENERLLAAETKLVCGQFHNLVREVREQSIPVPRIRSVLDELEHGSGRLDWELRPIVRRFVHSGREAATSFYVYPTFDLMAYSETYEHMEAHAHTLESMTRLSKACAAAGYTATAPRRTNPGGGLGGLVIRESDGLALPPADVAVKDAQQAVLAVRRYLEKRPWGFFGATCDQWALMHYRWDWAEVVYAPREGEWVVGLPRDDNALGPVVIRYHVNAHSGATYGDRSNNQESQFAEGCDQY